MWEEWGRSKTDAWCWNDAVKVISRKTCKVMCRKCTLENNRCKTMNNKAKRADSKTMKEKA